MAANPETTRTTVMRSKYAAGVTNGMPLVSPTIRTIIAPLNKSVLNDGLTWNNWRNVKWGEASGNDYSWFVQTTQQTASMDNGSLVSRSFEQENILTRVYVYYYNIEYTWALAMRDRQLNKRDDASLRNIEKDRMTHARNAVYRRLAQCPFHADETDEYGGLGMFSPTKVGTSTTYASRSMAAANTDWTPATYDYGTKTIAANLFEIIGTVVRQLSHSVDASGGGGMERPDCAVCDPDAWPYVLAYFESNFAHQIQSGTLPKNLNMLEDGVDNIVIDNVMLFHDSNFGLATGYIDGAAAEEIMVYHSNAIEFVTHASKAEGFIQEMRASEKDDPKVRGDVGVFSTGMHAMRVKTPKKTGLCYT